MTEAKKAYEQACKESGQSGEVLKLLMDSQ